MIQATAQFFLKKLLANGCLHRECRLCLLVLRGMEWVKLTNESSIMGAGQGIREFLLLKKVGTGDACAHTDDLRTRIASRGFVPGPPYGASLGIRGSGFSHSSVGGKNSVWHLWPWASDVLRPHAPLDSGPVLWRYAHLPGGAHSAGVVPDLPESEAGAAGLVGRQPVVHQTLCVLRWATLCQCPNPGCGPRAAPGLAHRQGAGEAVYAGAAQARRDAGSPGHRD